jgi:hypothetical protein
MSICVTAWKALERLRVDGKNTGQEYRRHEKEVMVSKDGRRFVWENVQYPEMGNWLLAFSCDALSDCFMAGYGLV